MKKLAILGAVAMSALLVTLGVVPSAQAYPEFQMTADVQPRVVIGGNTITSSSSAGFECQWTHEFNGKKKKGKGQAFSATFTTPVVEEVTVMPVDFTCRYRASSVGGASGDKQVATRTVNVKVLPQGADAAAPGAEGSGGALAPGSEGGNAGVGSDLPNTGGPNVIFLVLGLLLLLAGIVAVRFARTRDEDGGSDPSLA